MNPLMFITWDADPVMFSLLGIEVRYYGLCWAFALGFAGYLYSNIIKREGYPEQMFDSIFWYGVIGTIVGARLGHCLFYDPAYYLSHPIEILFLRQGGMASHGAAIGTITGVWLFTRKYKMPFLWALDRLGLASALGGAAVRLGNLMNSEIYGVPTELPWGFIFVRDGQTLPMHPTQIYEALCYAILFVVLYRMYFKQNLGFTRPGVMFGTTFIGMFATRFLIEFVKNPQVDFEHNMTLDMGQWLSIPFMLIGIFFVVRGYKNAPLEVPKSQSKSKAKK
ncbi:MAG: prolipoprotein diacylglyceryl transferase [Rikenellaceae bacterium]